MHGKTAEKLKELIRDNPAIGELLAESIRAGGQSIRIRKRIRFMIWKLSVTIWTGRSVRCPGRK
jgi:hypothetical protein